jgi:DinB superfamily
MFDPEVFTSQLERNAHVFRLLVAGLTPEQERWKPVPDQWSILEIINHLADEDAEDFRARLDATLHQPTQAWTPIDPQGWVTERAYNTRNLDASLERFVTERYRSVVWLRSLKSPAWNLTHTNQFGTMSARELLASWVAHDWLHVRQITRLHYRSTALSIAPESVEYAGEWDKRVSDGLLET